MKLLGYLTFILALVIASGEIIIDRIRYQQDGDLIIGGLFPLHNPNETTQQCAERRGVSSFRLVEALVFAVKKINANATRLGGLTLGYEIYDTCASSSVTLKNALAFIPSIRADDNILGVVGAQRSSSSTQATELLGIYNISIVSYLSTSDDLSNNEKYPYFLRTVPPDKFQVNAIVDLLIHFDWKYVAFLYSDDTYGINAYAKFTDQVKNLDICIGYSQSVGNGADYNQIISDLMKKKNDTYISVVILFIHNEMAKDFFAHATQKNIRHEFIWIGSDGWGNYGLGPLTHSEETALGAFTIVPKSGHLEDFSEYLQNASITSDNPWLNEFISNLTNNESNDRPHYESIVSDTVELLATAISNVKEMLCDRPMLDTRSCVTKIIQNRTLFRNTLLEVSILSPSNGELRFTSKGDGIGRYDIRQLHKTPDGDYKFEIIGNWSEVDNISLVTRQWYLKSRYMDNGTPISVCNKPCAAKEITVMNGCNCWTCQRCKESEMIKNNTCVLCYNATIKKFDWPNEDVTTCEPLEHINLIDEPENIVVIVVSSVGIIVELIVAILFVKNREQKLIRASSRELGFIILVGVFLLFTSSMLYGIQASHVSCLVLRAVPSFGLSLMFVSIATMTIRLNRIFKAGKKSAGRPQFISPQSQFVLTLMISLIPMIWSICWIIAEPHSVHTEKHEEKRFLVDACVDSSAHLIGQLIWHFVNVIICCYYAVCTRNLPANYNQSRFIAFTAFSTLIVLIAFTPAYFLSNVARSRDMYRALGGIIVAAVVLILLFIVRLYAVYFVKEELQLAVSTNPYSVPTTTTDENLTLRSRSTILNAPTNGSNVIRKMNVA